MKFHQVFFLSKYLLILILFPYLLRRWKSVDVEVPDAAGNSNVSRDNITHPITHLKPYTRYAYYVRTYTIAMETNGAQSKIQYFTTNPSSKFPRVGNSSPSIKKESSF